MSPCAIIALGCFGIFIIGWLAKEALREDEQICPQCWATLSSRTKVCPDCQQEL